MKFCCLDCLVYITWHFALVAALGCLMMYSYSHFKLMNLRHEIFILCDQICLRFVIVRPKTNHLLVWLSEQGTSVLGH